MDLRLKGISRYHRGVIGVESAIVMITFVIVAAALAFVVLNMGFTTSQKAKTTIISGLSEISSTLQVSGTITGVQCLSGGNNCGSSLAAIAIPLKIVSGGNSANLDPAITIVTYLSNTVQYDNIYKGTVNVSTGFIHVTDFGSSNDRVQVFDSSGNHQLTFGTLGSNDGQFDTPVGIAVNMFDKSFISTTGLAAGNGLITSIIDTPVGLSLTQTSAWIYFPVTDSYNSILDYG